MIRRKNLDLADRTVAGCNLPSLGCSYTAALAWSIENESFHRLLELNCLWHQICECTQKMDECCRHVTIPWGEKEIQWEIDFSKSIIRVEFMFSLQPAEVAECRF